MAMTLLKKSIYGAVGGFILGAVASTIFYGIALLIASLGGCAHLQSSDWKEMPPPTPQERTETAHHYVPLIRPDEETVPEIVKFRQWCKIRHALGGECADTR